MMMHVVKINQAIQFKATMTEMTKVTVLQGKQYQGKTQTTVWTQQRTGSQQMQADP